MGAAYDAMCENEGLQSSINKKNRQIREQKKIIIELVEGIIASEIRANSPFYKKAEKYLVKYKKKKK